jgi:hypothetical protein
VAHMRKPESYVLEIPACFLKGVQSGAREGSTRFHVLEPLHDIEGMAVCFGNANVRNSCENFLTDIPPWFPQGKQLLCNCRLATGNR